MIWHVRCGWTRFGTVRVGWSTGPNLPTAPQFTLNATNILNEPLRQTFEFPNAAFTYYEPGYTVLLGVRGTF